MYPSIIKDIRKLNTTKTTQNTNIPVEILKQKTDAWKLNL